MLNPIPLDINTPECPPDVINSNTADLIRYCYKESRFGLDPLLLPFLQKYPENMGHEWEDRLLKGLEEVSIELHEKWVSVLPAFSCRAAARFKLKERKLKTNSY